MKFPFELRTSKENILDDLSNADIGADYLACFGKAKNLSVLSDCGNLKTLWVSGVNEKQAACLPAMNSLETLIIHDLRASDLSILIKFPNLKTLMIWGSSKATSLKGIEKINGLNTLGLEHFPKVRSIKELSNLNNLKMLYLTGSFDTALKLDTLAPISKLQKMEWLHISNLQVLDESLAFVKALARLKELQVSNQFPTLEYAALKAHCPNITCTHFAPYIQSSLNCESCDSEKVMVIGKRKPFVCPLCNSLKLEKYKSEFNAMVSNEI